MSTLEHFQWSIDHALVGVARVVVRRAIDAVLGHDYQYTTSIPDGVLTIRVARRRRNEGYKKLCINLREQPITAARLVELHNQITAWILNIKEGGSACS